MLARCQFGCPQVKCLYSENKGNSVAVVVALGAGSKGVALEL